MLVMPEMSAPALTDSTSEPDPPSITGKDSALPCGQNLPAATSGGASPTAEAASTTLEITAQGTAFSVAAYDRTSQRISNVQAARDAETRNAKVIAEAIRTRIAAALASRG